MQDHYWIFLCKALNTEFLFYKINSRKVILIRLYLVINSIYNENCAIHVKSIGQALITAAEFA